MRATGRPQTRAMRAIMLVAAFLVFIAGFQLFVLSEATDRFFAWKINPPLTAAFLGAGYWASFVLEIMAARERLWERGRIAVSAVLIFTVLTLIATVLHYAPPFKLHMESPDVVTRGATIAWIIVYAAVPPLLAVILAHQLRQPGGDGPRLAPLPGWLRGAMRVQGGVMFLLGALMFIVPTMGIALWPWQLSALTARAVGAWLVGLGVAALHIVVENDFVRVRSALLSSVLFSLLLLVGLARYPDVVAWERPTAWLYLLFVASIGVVGAAGLVAGRHPRSTRLATPAPQG